MTQIFSRWYFLYRRHEKMTESTFVNKNNTKSNTASSDIVRGHLEALRSAMKQRGLDAYYVPTADYHLSEYTGDHFKFRSWLSGFTVPPERWQSQLTGRDCGQTDGIFSRRRISLPEPVSISIKCSSPESLPLKNSFFLLCRREAVWA